MQPLLVSSVVVVVIAPGLHFRYGRRSGAGAHQFRSPSTAAEVMIGTERRRPLATASSMLPHSSYHS
jgi:hypothetical protein